MIAGTVKEFAGDQWHNVKLQFAGTSIAGFVDGVQVLTVTNSLHSHGMAGLVTGDCITRNSACFDNLLIKAVGAETPKPTVFATMQVPIYDP
jgi:hypothetical protein